MLTTLRGLLLKEDDTIGICGDYKQTINQVANLDNYPSQILKICMRP